MTTRVLVVDDHELFRQGVVATLEPEDDFDVVGQAGTAAGALTAAEDLQPDLILLDVHMPGGDGLSVVHALRAVVPKIRLVMLTVSEDPDTVTEALGAGAVGYLVKGVHAGTMLEALRGIVAGETYVSPEIAGRILATMTRASRSEARPVGLGALTPRERDVLELLARGETNREIATALTLSDKTVKRHVTGILTKLQVRNRTEAALQVAKLDGGGATRT
jgi:DNA-binding NarL/FixJ family response regulator